MLSGPEISLSICPSTQWLMHCGIIATQIIVGAAHSENLFFLRISFFLITASNNTVLSTFWKKWACFCKGASALCSRWLLASASIVQRSVRVKLCGSALMMSTLLDVWLWHCLSRGSLPQLWPQSVMGSTVRWKTWFFLLRSTTNKDVCVAL